MTNIFNQIYLIDFQNISSKFGLLWKFISQLFAQDILAFGEHFADIHCFFLSTDNTPQNQKIVRHNLKNFLLLQKPMF